MLKHILHFVHIPQVKTKCLNQKLTWIIIGKVIWEMKVWAKEDVNETVVILGSSILLFNKVELALKTEPQYEAWTHFYK